MQTALLGLAIAFILALVAALAGPFVVDWNNYRTVFEKEATRLAGVDVRIGGKIDGRLLPSPRLSMGDVTIGAPGVDALRARSLDVEFALGPLMRGDWRASDLRLAGLQMTLGVDGGGRTRAPKLAINFDPEALLIERLTVEDGKVTLGDAGSGASVTLDKLWFNGEVKSLLGPVKGEGAFTSSGRLFPFRLAAGRVTDGAFKLHLNVDPSDTPLSAEADGTVTISGDEPRYEGALVFTRPAAVARSAAGGELVQPWRIGGKLKASPKAALMELVEFQYGSGEQAVRLTGTADFRFGKTPRFDGVVSGRQIDLDRVLSGGDSVRVTPAASIRKLVQLANNAFDASIPIRLGVGIDSIGIGGATVQNLRGDITSVTGGWLLDRFEFRAPGLSQVRLSGQLSVAPDGVSYTGPADINSADPRALAGWLQGITPAGRAVPRAVRARGDVTLASDRVAIERLHAQIDREALTGRMVYVFGNPTRPARLEAALNAPELDVDAVQAFVTSVTQGAGIERPQDVSLSLDIGRATVSGYEARQASVQLQVDANGLRLDRLAVADFGGAAMSASGRLQFGAAPSGQITLDLDAKDLSAVAAAAAAYLPSIAAPLRRAAADLVPARIRSSLTVDSGNPALRARVSIKGNAGPLKIDLSGQAGGKAGAIALDALLPSDVRIDGNVTSQDGRMLAAILGLDKLVTTAKTPIALTVSATGTSLNELKVGAKLTGSNLDMSVDGSVTSIMSNEPRATLVLNIIRADVSALRGRLAAMVSPLLVSLTSKLAVADGAVRLDDINGQLAGSVIRGRLAIGPGPAREISGELDLDVLDGAALIAASAGAPPSLAPGVTWTSAPFGPQLLADYSGRVVLKASRAELMPGWTARAVRADLQFGGDAVALQNITGTIAGGQFGGNLTMRSGAGGLALQSRMSVKDADASALTPSAVRAPIAGKLGLTFDIKGAGLSPATLIGSLSGSGTMTIGNLQLAGLDPRVFSAVLRASEQNAQSDLKKLAERAGQALDTGPLSVRQVNGEFSISAGQVRVNNLSLKADEADASLSGRFDASEGTIDARLALTGHTDSGPRPILFIALRGPATSPARSIDVSALAGWLTLKSIERQSKQIQAIEANSSVPPPPAVPSVQAPQIVPHVSTAAPQRSNPAESPVTR